MKKIDMADIEKALIERRGIDQKMQNNCIARAFQMAIGIWLSRKYLPIMKTKNFWEEFEQLMTGLQP